MNLNESTLEYNGRRLSTQQGRLELFAYYIQAREAIRVAREAGKTKPWSTDEVFQTTYFTNVRREDDKVTKWIRNFYSDHVMDDAFEFNIALSRWINWPDTLQHIGYVPSDADLAALRAKLEEMHGKIFGHAYIVSTNGLAMGKAQYLCEMLLPAAYNRFGKAHTWRWQHGSGSLAHAYSSLINVRGLGSFMAGQILADLKNTKGHPLSHASDFYDFAVPGPGSKRGVNWIIAGEAEKTVRQDFDISLKQIRTALYSTDAGMLVKDLCNQDLQNCLCEYDKYLRVWTGSGRSKRAYDGR